MKWKKREDEEPPKYGSLFLVSNTVEFWGMRWSRRAQEYVHIIAPLEEKDCDDWHYWTEVDGPCDGKP